MLHCNVTRVYGRVMSKSIAALALAALVTFPVYAHTSPVHSEYALSTTVTSPRGDDNGDGLIDEDESGWDCATMGNRICGPSAN
ncbi:Uncharacterised protein [Mycolicibacterium phlei]|nr:hypothetical protein BB28_19100 [Mycobacteroides chelonae CCUG 47445]VEG19469.1 Uncharacterised protein [Mycolicibacterium phlei]